MDYLFPGPMACRTMTCVFSVGELKLPTCISGVLVQHKPFIDNTNVNYEA